MNEKAKHTPGPWNVGEYSMLNDPDVGYPLDTQQIKTPTGTIHIIDVTEDYAANARLIASAPELLEALKNVVEFIIDDKTAVFVEARAAIAKATAE